MKDLHECEGQVAAGIGQPFTTAGDREGLAGRPGHNDVGQGDAVLTQQIGRDLGHVAPEQRVALIVIRRRLVAQPMLEDGARERLDLGRQPPVNPRGSDLGRTDAGTEGHADHLCPSFSLTRSRSSTVCL